MPRRVKKKKGPLLVSKAAERFSTLDRNVTNQSEMSLKLPDIKQRQSRDQNDLALNYTEDKKSRMRAKLEALYSIKLP